MRRLAPSEAIRNEIQNALNQRVPEGKDMMSWLVTKSVQRLLQEILEQGELWRCFARCISRLYQTAKYAARKN